MSSRGRPWRRWLGLLLAGAGVALLDVLLVLALVAAGLASPAAFALGNVLAAAVVLGLRAVRARRRRRPATVTVLVTLTGLVLGAVVMLPRPVGGADAGPPRAERVPRPSGGYLAATTYGGGDLPPLVVVHGGPGIPLTGVEERQVRRLADDRPVVVYDQVGTGHSSHLTDPDRYTLATAVADLDTVVRRVLGAHPGAARVAFLGYSWGASVVTAYAAEHPDRVSSLVLMSPGEFPWAEQVWPSHTPATRLTTWGRVPLYGTASEPRNLFLYAAVAAAPDAVPWFVGEDEADRRFATLYRLSTPGLTCRGEMEDPDRRVGFYAGQVPQLHPDLTGVRRAQLPELSRIPALVLRGSCDYIGPGVAADYHRLLARSRYVRVAGAGHALLVEAPDRVVGAIDGFLSRSAG